MQFGELTEHMLRITCQHLEKNRPTQSPDIGTFSQIFQNMDILHKVEYNHA